MNNDVRLLSIMVRGAYDMQMLRMQTGIRLCANFRAKLLGPSSDTPKLASTPASASEPKAGSIPRSTSEPKAHSNPEGTSEPNGDRSPDAFSEPQATSSPNVASDDAEAKKILDRLRASYKTLTAGIARHRTLPAERGFTGDEVISSWAELALVDQFLTLEREEAKQFRLLASQLARIPVYTEYLEHQVGVGPAMAGVIVSRFDPHKARHVSSFWKFAGLDVGLDGRGRSRRAEHLVEREYVDRNGDPKVRQSITYDPFVKTKMMGVLSGSFIRSGSPWRKVYDDYKHRLETDPAREKVTLAEWKRRRKKGAEVAGLWTPGRIDTAAKRYMVKMFLADLWVQWRTLEGLPVTESYSVAKQGRRPHAA